MGVHDPGSERIQHELEGVQRALSGDRFAFDALYARHFPRVFRLVHAHLGPAAAEDATAAVFETLIDLLPAYRGERPLATWIATLAHHEITLRSGVRRLSVAPNRRAAASPVP